MGGMKKIALLLLLIVSIINVAQDTDVWVTTQDNSRLRAGASLHFETLAIIPHTTTLEATGRTADSRWVQVTYDGQTGWIAARLLVWSGDFAGLPIDGTQTVAFVRRTGVLAITTRDTPIYATELDPSDQVGIIPEETEVEVIARFGNKFYRPLQVVYNGQSYWVGSWNLRILSGRVNSLLDNSYLLPFGRLTTQITKDINLGNSRLREIERIWTSLRDGRSVSCDRVPEYIIENLPPDVDIRHEPIFAPVVTALDAGNDYTNTAISLFEDACNRAEPYISEQDVQDAIDEVNNARRNYNLARSVLESLFQRGPLN